MPSLKDVKAKISGVKKTRQITKAMNMVAASRLRGAQLAMESFRPYAGKFAEVLGSLAERAGGEAGPLIVPKEHVKKVCFVLCTSDRGLCGGFNTNAIHAAEDFVKKQKARGVEVALVCFGKKGRDWARKNKVRIVETHLGIMGTRIPFSTAAKSGQKLIDSFINGDFDEIYVGYTRFVSMARQTPVLQQLLPIPAIEKRQEVEAATDQYLPEHICEPSAQVLLEQLLPRSVFIMLFSALLETSTSEHAARMAAMDNATKACNDMLDVLTLTYNKARQAAITKELMDIVGGAEALKG
jgi:F-type H+-transporting ATPase subunit gamma